MIPNTELSESQSNIQTILVVDDIEANRLSIQQMLLSLSVRVLVSSSGQNALEIMRSEKPDLILLDDTMPDMDGYQVINQQQFLKDIRHIPIILMTSHLFGHKQSLHHYLLDVIDTLAKPFSQSMLLTKVQVFLEVNRYRDIIRQIDSDDDNVLNSSQEGILGIDASGLIRYVNSAASYLLKIAPSKLVGLYLESLFEDSQHLVESQWQEHPVYKVCERQTILQVEKAKIWQSDGLPLMVRFAAVPVNVLGEIKVVFAFRRLESEGKASVDKLSGRDPLTALSTRKKFEEELDRLFEKAKEESVEFGLLYFDLMHFKHVNESLGHNVGDEIIKMVADRLKRLLRTGDAIARSSGDEFIILACDLSGKDQILSVADKICYAMKEAFLCGGHELHLGCNIGIVTYPRCGHNASQLIKNASFAAEQAKKKGRNTYCYFDPKLNEKLTLRVKFNAQFQQALLQQDIQLLKSPIYQFYAQQTDEEIKPFGFYVSPSWSHADYGDVGFHKLFDLACRADLLASIWVWLFQTSLQEIALIDSEERKSLKWILPVTRDVIHSGILLSEKALLVKLAQEVSCVFAFEESAFFARTKPLQATIQMAQELGIDLALWQFGGEYGSISILESLPIRIVYLADRLIEESLHHSSESLLSFYAKVAAHFKVELWCKNDEHPSLKAMMYSLDVKAVIG